MNIYKPRKCEICDKDFVPAVSGQIFCSPECGKQRKALQSRIYRRNRKIFIYGLIEKLDLQVAYISELETEVASLKKELTEIKKVNNISNINKGIDTSKFKYCQKMRLRMKELPCGRHPDCWNVPVCKNTKGLAKDELMKDYLTNKLKSFNGKIWPRQNHYTPVNNPLDDISNQLSKNILN